MMVEGGVLKEEVVSLCERHSWRKDLSEERRMKSEESFDVVTSLRPPVSNSSAKRYSLTAL